MSSDLTQDKFLDIPNIRDLYIRKVRLERVVDGDTIDVWKDMGERVWKLERYRLLGIDTPERGRTGFYEASHRLEELIKAAQKDEGFFWMLTAKHGKFRWLGVLYDHDGVNLNRLMVEEGHAKVYGT